MPDEYNVDVNDDDISMTEHMDNQQLLIVICIPIPKVSRDTKSNTFGRRMIDMCKSLD